jgi:hypothetical protein
MPHLTCHLLAAGCSSFHVGIIARRTRTEWTVLVVRPCSQGKGWTCMCPKARRRASCYQLSYSSQVSSSTLYSNHLLTWLVTASLCCSLQTSCGARFTSQTVSCAESTAAACLLLMVCRWCVDDRLQGVGCPAGQAALRGRRDCGMPGLQELPTGEPQAALRLLRAAWTALTALFVSAQRSAVQS